MGRKNIWEILLRVWEYFLDYNLVIIYLFNWCCTFYVLLYINAEYFDYIYINILAFFGFLHLFNIVSKRLGERRLKHETNKNIYYTHVTYAS